MRQECEGILNQIPLEHYKLLHQTIILQPVATIGLGGLARAPQ